jgi:hypothetical protein
MKNSNGTIENRTRGLQVFRVVKQLTALHDNSGTQVIIATVVTSVTMVTMVNVRISIQLYIHECGN